MTAMLSVVLPNVVYEEKFEPKEQDRKPKGNTKCGSYVIREINQKKYCFELYDKQDKFLVRSYNCYKTIADVKQAIGITRKNGEIAEVEDRTVNWIKEANHPKFEMFKDDVKYYFKLTLDNRVTLFKSEAYETLQECKKQLDKAMASVKSLAVYISVDKLLEDDAQQYKNMKPVDFGNEQPEQPEQPEQVEQAEMRVQPEAEKAGVKVDESAVIINTGEKKTLWESYSDLSKQQKAFFDGLRKAAQEKEGSREFESSSQLSYVLFKDKLMRIQIKRNTVEAIFMLMDSTFKQMQNGSDIKIKETKTVVRIENDAYYSLALETLNKKYDLLKEQKVERDSQKKQERLEKLRKKRLENKGK